VFEELEDRIGVKATVQGVGCSLPTYYNWKKRRFWRMDKRFAASALQLLSVVRHEQLGWTRQEAKIMRDFIYRTKHERKARKQDMSRDDQGRFTVIADPVAMANRIFENAIDLEEFGREELAKRAIERAKDSASTNGVARAVHVRPGDNA
jgi:hypothetical protein